MSLAILGLLLASAWMLYKSLRAVLFVRLPSSADPGWRARASSTGPAPHASTHLRWPAAERLQPARLTTVRETTLLAYKVTTRAAASLHVRNLQRKQHVDAGQQYLFAAACLGGLAIACYLVCSSIRDVAAIG